MNLNPSFFASRYHYEVVLSQLNKHLNEMELKINELGKRADDLELRIRNGENVLSHFEAKLNQQEVTIAQLIEIIATTNSKVTTLVKNKTESINLRDAMFPESRLF